MVALSKRKIILMGCVASLLATFSSGSELLGYSYGSKKSYQMRGPAKPVNNVSIDRPAPTFVMKDTNNVVHDISKYKGKIVVLEWKNHDCPFVRKHYGSKNMQKLQKWATKRDVVWLSIISSAKRKQGYVSPKQANAIVAKEKSHATGVILDSDGKIGRLYQAKTTPHMFVIGPNGNLAYKGAIDDNPSASPKAVKGAKNYVKEAIVAIQSNKPLSVKSTRPYGCSVKY